MSCVLRPVTCRAQTPGIFGQAFGNTPFQLLQLALTLDAGAQHTRSSEPCHLQGADNGHLWAGLWEYASHCSSHSCQDLRAEHSSSQVTLAMRRAQTPGIFGQAFGNTPFQPLQLALTPDAGAQQSPGATPFGATSFGAAAQPLPFTPGTSGCVHAA